MVRGDEDDLDDGTIVTPPPDRDAVLEEGSGSRRGTAPASIAVRRSTREHVVLRREAGPRGAQQPRTPRAACRCWMGQAGPTVGKVLNEVQMKTATLDPPSQLILVVFNNS
ncbi:hypothetical protein GCM10009743_45120 [Kribbella swartbergensis]